MHCLYFLKIMFIILIHFSCVNCKNMYIYKYNFPLLFAFSLFFTLSFKSLYYPQLPVKHALGVKLQNCQHQKKLLTYYLLLTTSDWLPPVSRFTFDGFFIFRFNILNFFFSMLILNTFRIPFNAFEMHCFL